MMPAEQHLDLMVPFRFIYCILGALLFFKSNAPESARGVKTPLALSALLWRIFTTVLLPPPSYFDNSRIRFQRFVSARSKTRPRRGPPAPSPRGMPRCSPGSPAPILDWTKPYKARYHPTSQIMASLTPKRQAHPKYGCPMQG